MSYGEKPKHFLNLIHLMCRQDSDLTDADVDDCYGNAILITNWKSKMALAISVCCDGLRTFYTFEQVVPGKEYIVILNNEKRSFDLSQQPKFNSLELKIGIINREYL
jgi:hypothetical protein